MELCDHGAGFCVGEEKCNEDEQRGGGTPAFDPLKFKVTGVTDRDAPSLYGEAPERDLFALWADKVDLTDSSEDVSLSTSLFAAEAVKRLAHLTGMDFQRAAIVNPAMDFLRAEADLFMLEPKIVGRVVVVTPEEYAALVQTKAVPRRVWIELQHMISVANVNSAYIVATIDGTQVHYMPVQRDLVFTSNHVAECIQFWDYVRRGTPPPNAVIPPDKDPDEVQEYDDQPLLLNEEE